MLAGFITHAPLGPHELGHALTRMTDALVTSDHLQAHQVIFGPHVAGTAFAPAWRSTPPSYQTPSGHIAWLDGQFYNRANLTRIHRWQSTTDLEFLVRAVTGESEGVENIDGLFAGVVFDGHKNELHIVTDRYGLRPLYWTHQGDRIAWASQTKAFLTLPNFSPTIDPITREAFLATGQLPSDRTWLQGVEPFPPATRITFKISDGSFTRQHYWSWDKVAPLVGRQDPRELAIELGQRFQSAVNDRATPESGLILSGGLDSRAILAALPHPPPTFTFGDPQSADVKIAAQAASKKGATHTVLPLNDQNWLSPRIPGVWQTDGALDLLHMHGIEHLEQQKSTFDICFNGAGGDGLAGAGHLFEPHQLFNYLENNLQIKADAKVSNQLETTFKKAGSAHAFYIDWRMRGFTIHGPRLGLFHGLEYRLPFLDNQVQEFLYAIPLELKTNNRLYRQMLLTTYPRYFKSIPWQNTGFSISWPTWTTHSLRKVNRLRGKNRHHTFTDYANWLRQPPGRTLAQNLLQDDHAHYRAYANTSKVESLLTEHLSGQDNTVLLGRYITFELYLRQLFDGQYRTSDDASTLLEQT